MKKLLAFAVLSISILSWGTEYFVSNSGNDKWPGSRQKPFRSISRAISVARAGDIVTVRGGRYFEQLLVRQSGTPEKPIIIRGAPGETALLTCAVPVTQKWKKLPGYRFIYESAAPCEINMFFDSVRINRYLRVDSFDMLERQPGAFMLDKKTGKLYVNTFTGAHPDTVRYMIIPFFRGSSRHGVAAMANVVPVSGKTSGIYAFNKGVMIRGSHIIWENFHVAFFPGQGIRVNAPAQNVTIRNNTVIGGTCGIMFYSKVKNCRILNNRIIRVAGAGIQLSRDGSHCLVKGNFVYNCGTCSPFKEARTGSEGNIFSIAHYGSYQYTDIIDNTVISTERERCGRILMRNKGAIRKHTTQTGNVFYGGGVSLYATPDGTAFIANNTVVNGQINIGELRSNRKYTPVVKDNLYIRGSMKKPEFADTFHYDFRLRPDSPYLGKGAFPKAGNMLYVKPNGSGNGSTPAKAASLAAALKKIKGKNAVIYLLPGEYSGKAVISGTVKLANYQGGKAVADKLAVTGRGDVIIDGIIFRNSTVTVPGKLQFKRSVFDKSKVSSGSIIFENCTFRSTAAAGKTILRNSLVLGDNNRFALAGIISENNCFTSRSAWTAFRKRVRESHKSFFRTVKVGADLELPADSDLICAGLDCSVIGAKAAKAPVQKLLIEDLKWKQVSPDGIMISWSTPRHYCNVNARSLSLNPRKQNNRASFQQGDLRTSHGQFMLRKFIPGKKYLIHLYFYPINGEPRVQKDLTFVMPSKFVHKATTLNVDKKAPGAFRSISEAMAKTGPGDTVIVGPGIYTESVPIYLSGITLKSRIPGKAVMNLASLLNYSIMTINTRNVTIDGFKFIGLPYADTGKTIDTANVENFTLRNCHFDRPVNSGVGNIHLFGFNPRGMLIENCIFDSGFHGVWVYPAKDVTIRNCTFFGGGVNAIHVGCEQGWKTEIYNNIFVDTVANHNSPPVTVAEHGPHVFCDYNIYWKTKRCPQQRYYAFGRHSKSSSYSAPWSVKQKDLTLTFAETRKRYGVEKHGMETDPLLMDGRGKNFALRKDSPAIGRGRNGKNIGADFSVFK